MLLFSSLPFGRWMVCLRRYYVMSNGKKVCDCMGNGICATGASVCAHAVYCGASVRNGCCCVSEWGAGAYMLAAVSVVPIVGLRCAPVTRAYYFY